MTKRKVIKDELGASRIYALSDVSCGSDALNVEQDIDVEIARHQELGSVDARKAARNPLYRDLESSDPSSDVDDNTGSRVEQFKADEAQNLGGTDILTSSRCSDSTVMVV